MLKLSSFLDVTVFDVEFIVLIFLLFESEIKLNYLPDYSKHIALTHCKF